MDVELRERDLAHPRLETCSVHELQELCLILETTVDHDYVHHDLAHAHIYPIRDHFDSETCYQYYQAPSWGGEPHRDVQAAAPRVGPASRS